MLRFQNDSPPTRTRTARTTTKLLFGPLSVARGQKADLLLDLVVTGRFFIYRWICLNESKPVYLSYHNIRKIVRKARLIPKPQ